MATLLKIAVCVLGGIWVIETLLFLLSYRVRVLAEDAPRDPSRHP